MIDGARDTARRFAKAARARGDALLIGLLVPFFLGILGWIVAAALGVPTTDYLVGIIPTLVGVVAGLPLALWLIRVGEDVSGERDAESARERRRLVVGVIRDELQEALDEMHGDRAKRPRLLAFPFLKAEAWRALAASGELRWIDDPDLIARIARAYHRIEATTTLERAIFDFENDPTRKTIHYREGSVRPLDLLVEWLTGQDEHTIAAIDHALAGIRGALGESDTTS